MKGSNQNPPPTPPANVNDYHCTCINQSPGSGECRLGETQSTFSEERCSTNKDNSSCVNLRDPFFQSNIPICQWVPVEI